MGATNSLSSLLQEDLNSQKKQKVNVYVSDDDIIIHAVKRMYDSCWFTKKHMDKWEEKKDRTKTWDVCKAHFEYQYIPRKRYHDAKGRKVEETNSIDSNITKYWEAMEEQIAKEKDATTNNYDS